MNSKSLDFWIAHKIGLNKNISPKDVEAYQVKKLRECLTYARNKSSFYKALYAGVDFGKIIRVEDTKYLPLINGEDVRKHGQEMVCIPQSKIKRIVSLFSSGTTGIPKRLFFSEEDLELTIDFFEKGMGTFTEAGDGVMICMPWDKPDSIGDLLARGLSQIGVHSYKYGAIRDYIAAAEFAKKTKPDGIVGIPTQMLRLAENTPFLRPKNVLLSADYVPEAIRRRIEGIWQCETYAHYGLTESGLGGGVECGFREGYHLRHGDLIFEIIDPITGEILPRGKRGEVVFSTLTRTGMPLIRYRTGDISRIYTQPCGCGSTLVRLGGIEGRYANLIDCGERKKISIESLDEIIFSLDTVMDYTSELKFNNGAWVLNLILVTKDGRYTPAMLAYIKKCLDFDIKVMIEAGMGEGFKTMGTKKRVISINEAL